MVSATIYFDPNTEDLQGAIYSQNGTKQSQQDKFKIVIGLPVQPEPSTGYPAGQMPSEKNNQRTEKICW